MGILSQIFGDTEPTSGSCIGCGEATYNKKGDGIYGDNPWFRCHSCCGIKAQEAVIALAKRKIFADKADKKRTKEYLAAIKVLSE